MPLIIYSFLKILLPHLHQKQIDSEWFLNHKRILALVPINSSLLRFFFQCKGKNFAMSLLSLTLLTCYVSHLCSLKPSNEHYNSIIKQNHSDTDESSINRWKSKCSWISATFSNITEHSKQGQAQLGFMNHQVIYKTCLTNL